MILQTIGKKHSSVADKLAKVVNSATLECGQQNLSGWRSEVKNYLTDQGAAERGVARAPLGSLDDIRKVIDAQSLQSQAAADIVFLPMAYEQPGVLHNFGNALEATLKSVPEWAGYETKLRGVVKALGDHENKPLLIKEMFSVPECSSADRNALWKFPKSIVEHKWEHMEDLHQHVCACMPLLIRFYRTGVLDGTTMVRVEAAIADPFFLHFANWVFMFCRCVGTEASYYDGCFCHQHLLATSGNSYKRRLAMVEATGCGECPWKGKRLAALALGYIREVAQRVRTATSAAYTEALLAATSIVSARIVNIDDAAKGKWVAEVVPKFAYAEQIPYKIAGAFGAYIGYPLAVAKQCVADCFLQFEAIGANQQHLISEFIFGTASELRPQLKGFRDDPTTDLRAYPCAFVEVQERAFCGNSERHTEREHVGTGHLHTLRPKRLLCLAL